MTDKGFDFQSFDLLRYFRKRFWHLLIITAVGAVVAVVVSLLLEEKFKATVTVFPAPNTTISKELLSESVTDKNISQYGEEEEIERLLQVFQSNKIKNRVIDKYNLMEHYEIDTSSVYPQTKLYKKYDNNITASKTHLMSIEIEVLDKSPEYAAHIANDLAEMLDSLMNAIEKRRARKGLQIVKEEYQEKRKRFEEIRDSLQRIREKGINDYESQSEVYNKAYAEALAEGKLRNASKIRKELDTLSKYGGNYVAMRSLWESEIEQLSALQSRLEEAKVNAQRDMPRVMVVNPAYVPEKKAYPIRWLIVIGATVGVFVVTFLFFLIYDYIRNYYSDLFR